MQRRHGLKAGDFERSLQFCNWLSGQADDHRFIPSMIIGDEAGFSMNARVNVREYAPWGQQPYFGYAVPESRERITVWVGLCGNGELIRPVFFDRRVSGPSYLQMLNEEVLPQLLQTFGNHFRDGKFRSLRWAQYGAPAHRSVHDHIVALGRETEWPPRSPDLTPCDYFYGAI